MSSATQEIPKVSFLYKCHFNTLEGFETASSLYLLLRIVLTPSGQWPSGTEGAVALIIIGLLAIITTVILVRSRGWHCNIQVHLIRLCDTYEDFWRRSVQLADLNDNERRVKRFSQTSQLCARCKKNRGFSYTYIEPIRGVLCRECLSDEFCLAPQHLIEMLPFFIALQLVTLRSMVVTHVSEAWRLSDYAFFAWIIAATIASMILFRIWWRRMNTLATRVQRSDDEIYEEWLEKGRYQ